MAENYGLPYTGSKSRIAHWVIDTNECQLERAMDAIKAALMDIEDQKCELVDMQTKLDNTLLKLKQKE